MRVLGCTLVLILVAAPSASAVQAQHGSAVEAGEVATQTREALRGPLLSTDGSGLGLLDRRAGLSVEGAPLKAALERLTERSQTPILFSPSLLPDVQVHCDCARVSVGEALRHLLRDVDLDFTVQGAQVIISPSNERPDVRRDFPSRIMTYASSGRSGTAAGRDRAPRRGTVSGQVLDAETGEPVGAAQIAIPSQDLGAITSADGSYELADVPAGTHTITAQLLGYNAESQEVTVNSGESVRLDFDLVQEALALDELIVTGTPGGTERRALGNVVTTVDASDLTERAQVNTMQDLLTAQSPGLNFLRSSGNIGTGSQMRVRGVSSVALGQQPLIYVDGVRVQNSAEGGPDLSGLGGSGGQSSTFDDFSPDEIESIEVIKGPAAATLYGTEASAGVIQIITKRGEDGAPTFNASVSQGTNFMRDPSGKIGTQYGTDAGGNLIEGFEGPDGTIYPNVYEYEEGVHGNRIFEYGHSQAYSLNVRGGTESVNYFASGGWNDQVGVVDYNWNQRLNLRGNLSVLLTESLTLDFSSGYVSGETSFAQQLSEPGGIWEVTLWGVPELQDTDRRGFMRYTPEELETVEATRDYQRFTGSTTLTHDLGGWLVQRLVLGLDHSQEENQVLVPRHALGEASPFGGAGLGDVQLDRPRNHESTLDYSASASYRLSDAVGMTTSFGAQYYRSELNLVRNRGRILASPALRSIQGATTVSVDQTFVENKSLGLYLQQELEWNNRVFLTAAVRGDDNSAFGADFDAAIYPKVSGTWVISEEDFWGVPYVTSLRLRSALGQAGRQPDTFDAVTLYEPTVGRDGEPVMTPSTFGNPEVGPEVGTELEVGFDLGVLDDRIAGEFTYFHQRTSDALATVPLEASRGFPGSEVVNLGRLDNWGWEASLRARVVDRSDWSFDLGLSGDHTMNEVKDLGGRSETAGLMEGLPYPILTTDVILSAEFDDAGNPTNLMCDSGTGAQGREVGGEPVPCDEVPHRGLGAGNSLMLGPQFPTHNWTIDAALTLRDNLELHAIAEGQHGRMSHSINHWCRFAGCFTNTRLANALDDPIYVESEVFQQRFPYDRTLAQRYDASFWKLRQIGARYQLPAGWAGRVGAERASVAVSGNELWTIWAATRELGGAPMPDPESFSATGGADLGQMPGLASVSVRMDVTF